MNDFVCASNRVKTNTKLWKMTNVCVDWINLVGWETKHRKCWESNSNSISKVTKFSFSWLTWFFMTKAKSRKKGIYTNLSSHFADEIFEWHANGCLKMGTFFRSICLFCIITFMKWLSWALKTMSLHRLNVKRRQMMKHQASR